MNKIIIAILCIASLEAIALAKGINGSLLRIVIAAIMGLAGLATPAPKFAKILKVRLHGGNKI